MTESLRLPIPDVLTAEYVVVDPRNSAALPESSGRTDEAWVEWIGPDHAALPAPALLAGGGTDPRLLSRVYEAARHLLVTVRVSGALGPLGGGERPGAATGVVPAAGVAPVTGLAQVTAHVDQARAVARRLAGQSGGLLLDPMLARFPDPDPVGRDAPGDEGSGWRDHLRIGAITEGPGLTMFTMGLTRSGLPEFRTLGLPPLLGPAWARLLHGAALLLLTAPPGRAGVDTGVDTGGGTGVDSHPGTAVGSRAGTGAGQGGPVWLLPDEIVVSAVNDGTGTAARLGLRQAPDASRSQLLVVPPREFAGTEAEWRIELVHRLFPAARI